MITFQGQEYFDDRLFVLYLCKGSVEIESDRVAITLYHDQAPTDHIWCIVTYRNCNRYPLCRVDPFYKKDDAIAYLREVEPTVPLISLNGRSPQKPLSYDGFVAWKQKNKFRDYDYQRLYLSDGADGGNRQEHVYQTKDSFKGIR